MKAGPIKEMSFDEMTDLPNTLYKYRIWEDQYQQTILTERIVYMAAPTSFEDQKDWYPSEEPMWFGLGISENRFKPVLLPV